MVMLLLGILTAVALPRFFDRNTFQERAVFDDTLNALRYAQKLAVATNCQTQFQSTNTSYQVMTGSTCNSGTFDSPVINPATQQAGLSDNLNGLTITATPSNITFFPLGNASADATIIVAGKTIIIEGDTGFVYAQ